LALHLTQSDLSVLGHLFGVVVEFTLLFGHTPISSMPTALQNSACVLTMM
jgi:hypothetical protein